MSDKSYISSLELPNDPITHYIKDSEARDSITALQNKVSGLSTPEYALGVDATTSRMALYHYEEA